MFVPAVPPPSMTIAATVRLSGNNQSIIQLSDTSRLALPFPPFYRHSSAALVGKSLTALPSPAKTAIAQDDP